MNLVELELDETLADFEVQDWIDNVFSVQYPDVKARIKKGCSGLCHKKDEWHYVKDGKYPTHEKDVQVLYQDCDKVNSYTCLYDIHSESWLYYNLDNMLLEPFDYEVIAWKEIVLPELPKESE